MAITGNFTSDGLVLLEQTWLEDRWQRERQVLEEDGPESCGFVEASKLETCQRFGTLTHLSFNAIMRSRCAPEQLYAVQVVLPANWPRGEPLSYLIDPEIRYSTRFAGHAVPHIYNGGGFTDALCTHVGSWDTCSGKSSLAAYLFVVATWWSCFEEFIRRDGNLDYQCWCRCADWLIAHWGEDWSRGIPTR